METGLTRAAQNQARTKLRGFAFWHEQRRGCPATLHYRVDFPQLLIALTGLEADVTLEQVLHINATALKQLSKVGYMRARKAQVVHEFVDYAEVLRVWGMTCGVCGKTILRPLGRTPDALAFAYLLSPTQEGSHTRQHLRPVHVACAAPIRAGEDSAQLFYGKQSELSYGKTTERLTVREPNLLPPATLLSYGKQFLPYRTKITTEITTEITSSSAPPRAMTKDVQALYCALTGNVWRAQDEEVATQFQGADLRKVELALLETMMQTTHKRIYSFKYFVPRLQQWLAVQLLDVSLDTLLVMRRHRWQQQQEGAVARGQMSEETHQT